LRGKTRKLFNIAKRTGQWDTYKETLTSYNKEIRKAKRSSWRRYCQEIMVKQATKRVSTIKLPNGQVTKTGSGTLKKLIRVHFSDSELIDDSYDAGQCQLNLGICRPIMNRGNWNLAKRVNKQ
jgi:hypothetical protein